MSNVINLEITLRSQPPVFDLVSKLTFLKLSTLRFYKGWA